MPRFGRRQAGAACAGVVVLSVAAHVMAARGRWPAEQQTFRATTDLVLVDATVVGRDGSPVEGLTPDAFEVSIDGRRREVVSVEFQRTSAVAGPTERTAVGGAPVPSDANRVIVVAVDQSSFPASSEVAAREAVTRLIDRLTPDDYLGLVAFPGSVAIAPGRARAEVRAAAARLTGLRVEALTPRFNVSFAEAVALRSREPGSTKEITSRECRLDAFNATCPQEVIEDGTRIATALEQQAILSISGIHGVLDRMAGIAGRKTLIVVSAGLPISNRPGSKMNMSAETDVVARRAAAANVNLYVLYLNVHFMRAFSAASGRQNHGLFADIGLFGSGLERFADRGGGSFFQIEVDAHASIDRILRETSAAYLLAVRATPEDQDGRPKVLRVSIRRGGLVVRHRSMVTIPRLPGTVTVLH